MFKYVCVHVRRGDFRADSAHRKLYTILYQNYCLPPYNRYEKADEATQSENILNTLNGLVDNSYNVYFFTCPKSFIYNLTSFYIF